MSDPHPHPPGLAGALPVRLIRHAVEAAVAASILSYRYVLNSSLIWSEELVRYGLLWGVMLGAALASDRGAHVALEPLKEVLTPGRYRLVMWATGLLILLFCAVVGWYGWEYLSRLRHMRSPASQIPMPYVFAAIPVGCGLMAFFTLVHLVSGSFMPGRGVPDSPHGETGAAPR
jgi:TRAP-type C4-dicarboxylate transport system permease small subunit